MELAKLKWQCRRGSLELDLLLQKYVDTVYLQANDKEKARFVEMLRLDDEELQELIIHELKIGNP